MENGTEGRGGIRWDRVVEKVWKDIGGNQEEILSIEKFAGCKTEVKEKIEIRERQNAEIVLSCRGPGPARKKRHASSQEEEEIAQMCPCGKAVE